MKNLILLFLILILAGCKHRKTISSEEEITATKVSSKFSCIPAVNDTLWYASNNKAPLFNNLGNHHFSISTRSDLAQKYFNQGLILAYGFNHAEAARSFYYATKLDQKCAMCYWGYAYVLGPNYNAGMEEGNYQRAYTAIQKAKELADGVSEKERLLINALSKRYVAETVEDRTSLDEAYSKALKDLSKKYPEDTDINVLYVESLMNLHPWDLYDKEGNPKKWTPEIVNLLEDILNNDPRHPGAHHFYIHATEASRDPQMAYNSAAAFDQDLVPGAGHLVHMPSHVYIRTGDYHKGTLANLRAVRVDSLYVTQCHAQGAYPLAYYPHNYHFMAATAALEGNKRYAMLGANKVSKHVHPDLMKEKGWGTLQHYYVIPYYVMVKMGDWDAILNSKLETYDLPYLEAVRHYARGMAYLGKEKPGKAKMELAALQRISQEPALAEVSIWEINTVDHLVQIAKRVLKAEIMASETSNYEGSIALLEEAVAIEDALNYDEPPDWFFSVRHHLGAVLNEAGKYEEAVKVLSEDLQKLPKNGWAYHGLERAYKGMNQPEKLTEIRGHLKESWKYADIRINNSRVK